MSEVIFIPLIISWLFLLRRYFINVAKISYYETKLKNKNVDISHVENIGFLGLFKL